MVARQHHRRDRSGAAPGEPDLVQAQQGPDHRQDSPDTTSSPTPNPQGPGVNICKGYGPGQPHITGKSEREHNHCQRTGQPSVIGARRGVPGGSW